MALWIKVRRELLYDPRLEPFRQSELMKLLGAYLVARLLIDCMGEGSMEQNILMGAFHKFGGYREGETLLKKSGFFTIDDRGMVRNVEQMEPSRAYTRPAVQASVPAIVQAPVQAPVSNRVRSVNRAEQKRADITDNPLLPPTLPSDRYKPFQSCPWFSLVMEIALPGKELFWRTQICMHFTGYSTLLWDYWEDFMAWFMSHMVLKGKNPQTLGDLRAYVSNALNNPTTRAEVQKVLAEAEQRSARQ